MLWTLERAELNTQGPILGVYHVTCVLEDLDAPGPTKTHELTVTAFDYNADPYLILRLLQADGFTPSDWEPIPDPP